MKKHDIETSIKNAEDLLMNYQVNIIVSSEGVIIKVPTKYGDIRTVNLTDDWLCRFLENLYLERYGTRITPQVAKLAIRRIQAKAETEYRPVHSYPRTYFAEEKGYINTGNEAEEVIRVSAEGVNRIPASEVEVQFHTNIGEMAEYNLSGNPYDLFQLIRIPKKNWLVVLVALIASLIEKIEKPILSFFGEAGASKTTTAQIIKAILDPSPGLKDSYKVKTSAMPNKRDDFALIISQQYITIMDNVTHVSEEISDLMCQQSTGGDYEKRRLYTDTSTISLSLGGLLIITSISDVIKKDDAVDRAIKIHLEPINDNERIETSFITDRFIKLKPSILGGMLNTLSKALKIYPSIKDKQLSLPRLADFGRYGYAIAEALEEGSGDKFLTDYSQLRDSQRRDNLDSDGFITTMNMLLTDRYPYYWYGKMSECISALHEINNEEGLYYSKSCFPIPGKLGKKLNENISKLQQCGIDFTIDSKHSNSYVELRKIPTDYVISGKIVAVQSEMPNIPEKQKFDIPRVPILEAPDNIKTFNEGFIRAAIVDVFDCTDRNYVSKMRILKAAITE